MENRSGMSSHEHQAKYTTETLAMVPATVITATRKMWPCLKSWEPKHIASPWHGHVSSRKEMVKLTKPDLIITTA
ncbi:hypothetical protein D3C85_1582930 [compost metagenome]